MPRFVYIIKGIDSREVEAGVQRWIRLFPQTRFLSLRAALAWLNWAHPALLLLSDITHVKIEKTIAFRNISDGFDLDLERR